MKKSDLKTGMIVETNHGKKFLVMLNPDCEERELIDFEGGWLPLNQYNENLESIYNLFGKNKWNIDKVYSADIYIHYLLENTDEMMKNLKLLWERGEKPIEMTVAEIEQKLGVKNLKIVKEK